MQFLALTAGSPALVFPTETTLVVPFAFERPAKRVHCMLQGFDLAYPRADHHLTLARIEARVAFDELDSPTQGTVRVSLGWDDRPDPALRSALEALFVCRLLVVGE